MGREDKETRDIIEKLINSEDIKLVIMLLWKPIMSGKSRPEGLNFILMINSEETTSCKIQS